MIFCTNKFLNIWIINSLYVVFFYFENKKNNLLDPKKISLLRFNNHK